MSLPARPAHTRAAAAAHVSELRELLYGGRTPQSRSQTDRCPHDNGEHQRAKTVRCRAERRDGVAATAGAPAGHLRNMAAAAHAAARSTGLGRTAGSGERDGDTAAPTAVPGCGQPGAAVSHAAALTRRCPRAAGTAGDRGRGEDSDGRRAQPEAAARAAALRVRVCPPPRHRHCACVCVPAAAPALRVRVCPRRGSGAAAAVRMRGAEGRQLKGGWRRGWRREETVSRAERLGQGRKGGEQDGQRAGGGGQPEGRKRRDGQLGRGREEEPTASSQGDRALWSRPAAARQHRQMALPRCPL